MSARRLRARLDLSPLKFILPLRGNTKPAAVGISPDFSEKMFRRKSNVVHVEGPCPPPPPPPKDNGKSDRHYSFYGPRADWDDVQYAVMASPISENAPMPPGLADSPVLIISHTVRSPPPPRYNRLSPIPDEFGLVHPPSSPAVPSKPSRTMTSRIPVASGRVPPPRRRVVTISSPEEAEFRRREAQQRKALDEAEAQREETERQARLRWDKQQLMLEAAREEEARKAALDAELRRAAEERKRRKAIEHEADELTKIVAEERKRLDRERRREEARRHQQERMELEAGRKALEKARRAWRERVAGERRVRAHALEMRKTRDERGLVVLLTGWVTVQSEDCLSYKRRYFQLREDALAVFKDAEDDSKPLDTVQLSRIRRIREFEDGYEELQAIKHSFALDLRDVHDPWSMFTDSSEDKENLLAVLSSRLATR